MKKTFNFICLILAVTSLLAVSKKPLLEIFTSSTCPPCASANPIIENVLHQYPGQYSVIRYQMNFPGSGDPYYIPDNGIRRTFYGVNSVPSVFLNGSAQPLYNSNSQLVFTPEYFQTVIQQTTDLSISLDAVLSESNNLHINLALNSTANLSEGHKLQLAIVEKTTVENTGSNGETDFYYVLMKMTPDAQGYSLPAISSGTPLTLQFDQSLNGLHIEQMNDLQIVAFVQNNQTKSVLQSEMADITGNFQDYSLTFNIHDDQNNPVENAELYLEDYGTLYSNASGTIIYPAVYNGTYSFHIIKSGLFPYNASAQINGADQSINVIMETPGDLFYEDFEDGIPADWSAVTSSPGDFVYAYNGQVIIFRQSNTTNPLMLVSNLIDLSDADSLHFMIGEANSSINMELGTVSNPQTPASFTALMTYQATSVWQEIHYNLSPLSGSVYLAWRLPGSSMSYFSLDNVRITGTESVVILPPTGLTALISEFNNVDLNWEMPQTNRNLTGYKIMRDNTILSEINNPAQTSFTDSQLDAGNYLYSISALYTEGESSVISANITINLPSVTNLQVTIENQNHPVISWDHPQISKQTDKQLSGYKIYLNNAYVSSVNDTLFDLGVINESGDYQASVTALYSGDHESDPVMINFSITTDNISDENSTLSLKESLKIYPNPVVSNSQSNHASIRFSINNNSLVRINIYNVKGQIVRSWQDSFLTSGEHTINWNCKDNLNNQIPSGFYFVRIENEKEKIVKKVLVLR